ncbi:aldehyde dehydrogenase family protein [Arthrobacter agilis]|uniref:aldehyde dehydrogenase family protein n=1 Tax=Arthrobacter agilis TaxID=37921 RepID=UPI002781F4E7|nr:aldehyde dehydrogenase family protein [Arthrobacter agilis]MDQ0734737.1 aldehyde dehydrogenase (NAD(P)+) [Arthrobacter agilis]
MAGIDTTASPAPVAAGAFDKDLEALAAGAARWAAASLTERAALLRRVHESVGRASRRWATTAAGIKRIDADSALVGEEWMSGPYAVLGATSRLTHSLEALAAGRSPVDGLRFHGAPGGRTAVSVLPLDRTERLLLNGFSIEVWFPPGIPYEQVRDDAGLGARLPGTQGGVSLVLGAGNITAIAPLDALTEIVANNRAVLLKLNPVLGAMMTSYLDALDPLIRFGMLRIIQGGAETGSHLVHDPRIAHVHITGSGVTHDAVVFGTDEEGARRKAANEPILDKEITSELGGVSPVIVIPGKWSRQDIEFQAEHVATQRLHNGGFNCIASQMVIISSEWPQKDQFLAALRHAMHSAPSRPGWYPGSADRVTAAAERYPRSERLGSLGDRLLIELNRDDDATFRTTESFAPVLGVLEIPGTRQEFLDAAVALANDELDGTLGANIIVRPADRQQLGTGFGEAIAALRYGTIAINAWTALGFLTAAAPWGAFPGNPLNDVGSGRGVVHNALLLNSTERTVVIGPFRPFPRSVLAGEIALSPKPPWFIGARSAAVTGRLLADFAAKPTLRRLPGVLISAFRA